MSRLEPYLRSHCFELAEHRPKRRRVGFVGAFAERLKSAKDTGEFPLEFEPEVVAQIIGTYVQGLFRSVLLAYDRPQLERQVDQFLTSLGLGSHPR